MNWTFEELEKVKQAINEKARVNQEFRLLCLENPLQAVEQISGKAVPNGLVIRFVENEGAHLTHVLPDYISPSGEELSEVELEQVSAAKAGVNWKFPYFYCNNCHSKNIRQSQGIGLDAPYDCLDCGYHGSNLMND